MRGDNIVCVSLSFKLICSDEWQNISLSASDYFYREEDITNIDAIPKHNHAWGYLNGINKEKLSQTKLQLLNRNTGDRIVITEVLWNALEDILIERIDEGPNRRQHTIIYTSSVKKNPYTYQVIRLEKENDMFVPFSHYLVEVSDDGSESSTSLLR